MYRLSLIVVVTALTSPALAATATFTNVVDTTITGGHYFTTDNFQAPDVNNSGTVVFAKVNSNNLIEDVNTVYTGNGGPITPVTDSSAFSELSAYKINNGGTVAFLGWGTGGGHYGIRTRTGAGPLITIVQEDATFSSTIGIPGISANGNLTFGAKKNDGTWAAYRTTTSGGTLTPFVQGTSTFQVGGIAVNNSGTVLVGTFDTTNNFSGYYTTDGTTTADFGGTDLNILLSADMNNSGTVAISSTLGIGKYTDPNTRILVADGTSNTYSGFHRFSSDSFIDLGIADNGTVAFGAIQKFGPAGIFIGPNPATDKIIADGDPLFGSTLSKFMFGGGISDDGQKIAFAYQLANGTEGIAVATLPEPWGIAAIALAVPLLRRGYRRAR